DDGGRRRPPHRTHRRRAAGDREPHLADADTDTDTDADTHTDAGATVRLDRGRQRGPQLAVGHGQRQPQAGRRAPQPRQVTAHGERGAVDDLHRLEQPVTHGHPVVAGGDDGVALVDELAVDPHHAHGTPTACALATRINRRAFNSVSSHSPSGDESHVIAPPVPKCSIPSSNQNVRMATFNSPRRVSASTQPTAPQYTSRATGSSAAMCCNAAIFGAPVTLPGGNVAPMASAHPHPSRNVPVTVDTR